MRPARLFALSFVVLLGCSSSGGYMGGGGPSPTGPNEGGAAGAIPVQAAGGIAGSGAETSAGGSTGTGATTAAGGGTGVGAAIGAGGNTASGGAAAGGNTANGGTAGARTTHTGGVAGSAGMGLGGLPGSGGVTAAGGTTGSGGGRATGGSRGSGGVTGSGGTQAGGATGSAGAAGSSGGASGAGGTPAGGAGASGTAGAVGTSSWNAGNPNGSCSSGVPPKGLPATVSNPTVVGSGSAASCTFSALSSAVAGGGAITFDCGPDPVAILVTSVLSVPTNKDTVIDGGRKITLDGGGTTQIMRFDSNNFQANDHGLTLQHIALTNGKTTPTQMLPTADPPCSQGWIDGQGGALYVRDGYLVVVDAIFTNNQGAPFGPDTGGGAIYVLGSKGGVWINGSTFSGNQAANGGALGALFAELNVYNSLFVNNVASGHDANGIDDTMCVVTNNEVGSGGNGGALCSDGNDVNVNLCGDAISNNAAGANAFGGGLFFTSDDFGGTLSIQDTTMTGNTGGYWTQVASGTVTDAGSAVGTNCESITISNSMLQ